MAHSISYVSLNTDKGQQISIALAASGIPFKGRFDKDCILFDYDGDYKESVYEIIAKFASDEYAEQRKKSRSIRTVTVFISCLLLLKFCV